MKSSGSYTFREEKFLNVYRNIFELLKLNHEETGVYDMPFQPDFERYLFLEEEDRLQFFVIHFEKEIVGYAMFFIDREIYQNKVLSATQALNFVVKKHRGIGLAFMRFCDDRLERNGVNSIWRQSTAKFDIGKIYERMGYVRVETSYLRRV